MPSLHSLPYLGKFSQRHPLSFVRQQKNTISNVTYLFRGHVLLGISTVNILQQTELPSEDDAARWRTGTIGASNDRAAMAGLRANDSQVIFAGPNE